jgi:hypothetical protein
MRSHMVPFENRWTSGERAWQWYCELERLGLANVRAMFCDHETHHADQKAIIFDVPPGFVRDWLEFHDRRLARQQGLWRSAVLVLTVIAATAGLIGLLK